MNIIRTVTLVAIFIKCVTASTDKMSQFHKAVDEGNMVKAVKLLQSTGKYTRERGEMLNYVVHTRKSDFTFKFAKKAKVKNHDMLVALYSTKKSPEIIEEASKVFKFDQDDLRLAASRPELMCSPDDLVKILHKIEKQEDQELAIFRGVWNLFNLKRTECFDPLLKAFESSKSFKHLQAVAVKWAFRRGSFHGNKSIVEGFYAHPAVTNEDRADGLIWSGDRSTQNLTFNFLLEEADYADLNAVKKRAWYESRANGFKNEIEVALLTAKPSGSRSAISGMRAEIVMGTFEENPNMRVPTKISQLIITSYLVDESSLVDGSIPKSRIGLVDYVRESFDKDLIVEIPTVISELIASYVVSESAPEPRIRFVKLVMKILGNDDSGIRMATMVSQLILSYLSDESILESIATSLKQTIGVKRKYEASSDENA